MEILSREGIVSVIGRPRGRWRCPGWSSLTRTRAMSAPVQVVNFMNYPAWEWGKIAACGVLILLPVFVFSILMRRFLVHGTTAGAVKDRAVPAHSNRNRNEKDPQRS
jgi:hypothetical protein